jgi:hypothetical protein
MMTLRRRVYEIIEPGVKRDSVASLFEKFAIVVILASVAGAVFSTFDDLDSGVRNALFTAEIA